jgi:TetR/AcrR family transcriptional regulator, transcriptional repressor for nem operon
MRVSKKRAAENRERIVTTAARLFREHGFSGIGVDALTQAAGLTHGSLYSQFGSKECLAAEALNHALAKNAERTRDLRTLDDYVSRYLSADHRDRPGHGCAMAALAGEIPRQGPAMRHRFTDAVRATTDRLACLTVGSTDSGPSDEEPALATLATMVGALILARAVDDPGLSDRILTAARRRLTAVAPSAPSSDPSSAPPSTTPGPSRRRRNPGSTTRPRKPALS